MNGIGAIVLAAGRGTRFNGKKQFQSLLGLPLWEHVFQKAALCIDAKCIAVVGVDIPGGNTRTESVIHGLNALPKETKRVVILEAARPLVTRNQIEELINHEHPSTSFVMPLVNTVIMRNGTYLNRNELYDLLTPQAFDYQMLLDALETGKYKDMTDETRTMYEHYGILPKLLETTDNLIKVTYPKDLRIVEALMQRTEET